MSNPPDQLIYTVERDGKLMHLVGKKFGIQVEIPATHFAMHKQTFAEYYMYELQRVSGDMFDKILKEWETQNE